MDNKGTVTYENWKALNSGEELFQTLTYQLISDSDFEIDQNRFGPYTIRKSYENFKDFYIYYLDIDQYLEFEKRPDNIRTDNNKWHGGTGSDEMAALFSLQCGCKLKSAGFYTFKPAGNLLACPDYMIRPFGSEDDGIQTISFPKRKRLPNVKIKSVSAYGLINLYPAIEPAASIALVKAARCYQDGIWIGDSQPELAWLLLVSAIETASDYWRNNKYYNAVDLLKNNNRTLYDLLKESPEIEKIADKIAHLFNVGEKFKDFFLNFKAPIPENRPSPEYQISFSDAQMTEHLKTIYKYRSRALHRGISFPEPMCRVPQFDQNGFYEKPLKDGYATPFGYTWWEDKHVPMYLNTFEYLVRGALKQWWKSLTKI
jgi:hypothetical protein